MEMKQRIDAIRTRVADTCKRCGRAPSEIRIIAVSKTKPVEAIRMAVETGQVAFGENYAQELRDKAKELSGVEWHFIGRLQKNKVKYVAPVANWIHTVDSVDLIEAINKRLSNVPTYQRTNVLIEVNVAGESAKSGIAPEKVFDLVQAFQANQRTNEPTNTLALKGLMTMPPYSDNAEKSRPYFKKLRDLLNEINKRNIYPEKLTELSMGMSQDFEVAIEEGATMVRIGTAIFGFRQQ